MTSIQRKKKNKDVHTKTVVYKLYPNRTMEKVLEHNCDYRRFCWNQALEIWNREYQEYRLNALESLVAEMRKPLKERNIKPEWQKILDAFPIPNEYQVRDLMVARKQSWQTQYSAHLLQLAVKDLGDSWDAFKTHSQDRQGKPRFKSKKSPRRGFKSDQAKLIVNENGVGFLSLEKPKKYTGAWYPIRMSEAPLSYSHSTVSIYHRADDWYVSIPYDVPNFEALPKTGKVTGVDVNVSHFNYKGGTEYFLHRSDSLSKQYKKIKHYQRLLGKKINVNGRDNAKRSKRYQKTRIKLQKAYKRAADMQTDLMQKFSTMLVQRYDSICIESLNVKGMLMSHVTSKGVHRAMFGKFKSGLEYKCKWYGRELVMAHKQYPSTQRCSVCGYVKKDDEKVTLWGNKKHGTKHNEYVCYNPECPNYNQVVDRDVNAMLNLTYIINHPELNKAL